MTGKLTRTQFYTMFAYIYALAGAGLAIATGLTTATTVGARDTGLGLAVIMGTAATFAALLIAKQEGHMNRIVAVPAVLGLITLPLFFIAGGTL